CEKHHVGTPPAEAPKVERAKEAKAALAKGYRIVGQPQPEPAKPAPKPRQRETFVGPALVPMLVESGPGIKLDCCAGKGACRLHRTEGPSYVSDDGYDLLP